MALSTPQAILLGFALAGAFSGAGLYFGLRARSGGPATTTAGAGPASVESTTSMTLPAATDESTGVASPGSPATVGDPGADGVSAAAKKAKAEIESVFASRHAQAVVECWQPSVARNPLPASQTVTFELGFDATGTQTFRSLLGGRATRPEVNACLIRLLDLKTIAPPGAATRVRVPVTLP